MFSGKQGDYWYHFYNIFDMTRSLTGDWTRDLPHSKPAHFYSEDMYTLIVKICIRNWLCAHCV